MTDVLNGAGKVNAAYVNTSLTIFSSEKHELMIMTIVIFCNSMNGYILWFSFLYVSLQEVHVKVRWWWFSHYSLNQLSNSVV